MEVELLEVDNGSHYLRNFGTKSETFAECLKGCVLDSAGAATRACENKVPPSFQGGRGRGQRWFSEVFGDQIALDTSPSE